MLQVNALQSEQVICSYSPAKRPLDYKIDFLANKLLLVITCFYQELRRFSLPKENGSEQSTKNGLRLCGDQTHSTTPPSSSSL
jgi:hypothetical protein